MAIANPKNKIMKSFTLKEKDKDSIYKFVGAEDAFIQPVIKNLMLHLEFEEWLKNKKGFIKKSRYIKDHDQFYNSYFQPGKPVCLNTQVAGFAICPSNKDSYYNYYTMSGNTVKELIKEYKNEQTRS
jgi:hypothetical protein